MYVHDDTWGMAAALLAGIGHGSFDWTNPRAWAVMVLCVLLITIVGLAGEIIRK